MALRVARALLSKAAAAAPRPPALLQAVAEPEQRVPWHQNRHKLYRNLPATLRTWPGTTPGTTHRVELVRTALWKYRPVKVWRKGVEWDGHPATPLFRTWPWGTQTPVGAIVRDALLSAIGVAVTRC